MPRPSKSPLARFRVVVLPDFFLDAILALPSWRAIRGRMEAIVGRGGGNLPVGPIRFKPGGNAANLAIALARLGARAELITETDPLGMAVLQEARRTSGLGLDHVRVGPRSSATLALEFAGSNLMLSHAGPLLEFGPERIAGSAWRTIRGADAVVVCNWAQNRSGTALLEVVARRLPRPGPLLFMDTSDPWHRGKDRQDLIRSKTIWQRLDGWFLNENELRAFGGSGKRSLFERARRLSRRLGCPLDLHTRRWAAAIDANRLARASATGGRPRRLTGAGDAWNAGNVAGYLLGLAPERRLRLAHHVAGRYVTGPAGLPPTIREIPKALLRRPAGVD